jgi:integrative and conjugative element protein (TIGR02256 family)
MSRRLTASVVLSATEVLLAESAETVLVRAAHDAHPAETGGLLFGTWSRRRPWVTHVVEVPPPQPRPAHYVVPAGVTHLLVACARRVDRRIGYLGEWHVHPADAGPSETDVRTMRRLASQVAKPPVLLLARFGSGDYDLEAHVWSAVRHRKLTIVRTGDLAKE